MGPDHLIPMHYCIDTSSSICWPTFRPHIPRWSDHGGAECVAVLPPSSPLFPTRRLAELSPLFHHRARQLQRGYFPTCNDRSLSFTSSISPHQKETFPLRETMCFLEKMQAPSVHQLDDDNLTWDAPEKKTTFLIRQGPYFRRHEGRIVAVQTCCSTDSSNCAVDVTIRNVECTRRRRRREQRQSHQGRSHAPRSCSLLRSPLFG